MDNGVLKLGCSSDKCLNSILGRFFIAFYGTYYFVLGTGEASVGNGHNRKIMEEFRKIAGDIKIIDRPEEKEMYSHDIGEVPSFMTKLLFKTQPSFVVQPKNIAEIQKVLAFANEKRIPVIPRGAASWGFGGVIPPGPDRG
jgi:hypothetical protein